MNGEKYESRLKRENRIFNGLVYFIIITTFITVAPLAYKFAESYFALNLSAGGNEKIMSERTAKNKKYNITENTVDISALKSTEFGALFPAAAKITDSGEIILLCSGQIEKITGAAEDGGIITEYEDILRIVSVKAGNFEISGRMIRYNFLESLRTRDYTFKDYGGGTFFLSNNKTAFLFDTETMRTMEIYIYPKNINVYNTALSNDKQTIAMAAEEGFFVGSPKESNMVLAPQNMKELIAAVTVGGVTSSAKNPFWSSDDQLIFYKLYSDHFVKNAGVTTPSPGGNERLTALDAGNFIFLGNDVIFYYFSTSAEVSAENLFKCGYFDLNDRKMRDVMKSHVYYFDIGVSSNGAYLAALSHTGTMVKISVIDIITKRLIYSELYSEIYDFSFSPDEKNFIVYGGTDAGKILKVININWTEE